MKHEDFKRRARQRRPAGVVVRRHQRLIAILEEVHRMQPPPIAPAMLLDRPRYLRVIHRDDASAVVEIVAGLVTDVEMQLGSS